MCGICLTSTEAAVPVGADAYSTVQYEAWHMKTFRGNVSGGDDRRDPPGSPPSCYTWGSEQRWVYRTLACLGIDTSQRAVDDNQKEPITIAKRKPGMSRRCKQRTSPDR
nr:hypothetical protein CFP56_09081 [Quercus suber]